MKNKLLWLGVTAATLQLSACQNAEKQEEKAEIAATDTISSTDDNRFWQVLADIPTPYALLDALKDAGLPYNKSLFLDAKKGESMVNSGNKALAFGAYGVDLIVMASFEKSSDISSSLESARKLATELDASAGFERFNASYLSSVMNNKDSIRKMTNEVYDETSKYLISNKRLEAASLIAVGTFVESQYVATQMLKSKARDSKTEFLYNKIYESKLELTNLLKLVEDQKDKEVFKDIVPKLIELDQFMAQYKESVSIDQKALEALAKQLADVRSAILS